MTPGHTTKPSSTDASIGNSIDINCDMGEGMENDHLIMPHISSANIACGYHAGNEKTMWNTIEMAVKHKVAVGAHVSFLDRENFGRKEMSLSPDEVYELVEQQLIIITVVADSFDTKLRHVKPHGALYNMSAVDKKLANAIARAVLDFDRSLILFGPCGSHLLSEGSAIGLKTAAEAFADRLYNDDGSLVSRASPGALIDDANKAVAQTLKIVADRKVDTVSGRVIPLHADTICVHGDSPNAVTIAVSINEALQKQGIHIRPVA